MYDVVDADVRCVCGDFVALALAWLWLFLYFSGSILSWKRENEMI
jgi:hypothetical protein